MHERRPSHTHHSTVDLDGEEPQGKNLKAIGEAGFSHMVWASADVSGNLSKKKKARVIGWGIRGRRIQH